MTSQRRLCLAGRLKTNLRETKNSANTRALQTDVRRVRGVGLLFFLAAGPVRGGTELVRNENIGPSLGDELRNKALIALGVALLFHQRRAALLQPWTPVRRVVVSSVPTG